MKPSTQHQLQVIIKDALNKLNGDYKFGYTEYLLNVLKYELRDFINQMVQEMLSDVGENLFPLLKQMVEDLNPNDENLQLLHKSYIYECMTMLKRFDRQLFVSTIQDQLLDHLTKEFYKFDTYDLQNSEIQRLNFLIQWDRFFNDESRGVQHPDVNKKRRQLWKYLAQLQTDNALLCYQLMHKIIDFKNFKTKNEILKMIAKFIDMYENIAIKASIDEEFDHGKGNEEVYEDMYYNMKYEGCNNEQDVYKQNDKMNEEGYNNGQVNDKEYIKGNEHKQNGEGVEINEKGYNNENGQGKGQNGEVNERQCNKQNEKFNNEEFGYEQNEIYEQSNEICEQNEFKQKDGKSDNEKRFYKGRFVQMKLFYIKTMGITNENYDLWYKKYFYPQYEKYLRNSPKQIQLHDKSDSSHQLLIKQDIKYVLIDMIRITSLNDQEFFHYILYGGDFFIYESSPIQRKSSKYCFHLLELYTMDSNVNCSLLNYYNSLNYKDKGKFLKYLLKKEATNTNRLFFIYSNSLNYPCDCFATTEAQWSYKENDGLIKKFIHEWSRYKTNFLNHVKNLKYTKPQIQNTRRGLKYRLEIQKKVLDFQTQPVNHIIPTSPFFFFTPEHIEDMLNQPNVDLNHVINKLLTFKNSDENIGYVYSNQIYHLTFYIIGPRINQQSMDIIDHYHRVFKSDDIQLIYNTANLFYYTQNYQMAYTLYKYAIHLNEQIISYKNKFHNKDLYGQMIYCLLKGGGVEVEGFGKTNNFYGTDGHNCILDYEPNDKFYTNSSIVEQFHVPQIIEEEQEQEQERGVKQEISVNKPSNMELEESEKKECVKVIESVDEYTENIMRKQVGNQQKNEKGYEQKYKQFDTNSGPIHNDSQMGTNTFSYDNLKLQKVNVKNKIEQIIHLGQKDKFEPLRATYVFALFDYWFIVTREYDKAYDILQQFRNLSFWTQLESHTHQLYQIRMFIITHLLFKPFTPDPHIVHPSIIKQILDHESSPDLQQIKPLIQNLPLIQRTQLYQYFETLAINPLNSTPTQPFYKTILQQCDHVRWAQQNHLPLQLESIQLCEDDFIKQLYSFKPMNPATITIDQIQSINQSYLHESQLYKLNVIIHSLCMHHHDNMKLLIHKLLLFTFQDQSWDHTNPSHINLYKQFIATRHYNPIENILFILPLLIPQTLSQTLQLPQIHQYIRYLWSNNFDKCNDPHQFKIDHLNQLYRDIYSNSNSQITNNNSQQEPQTHKPQITNNKQISQTHKSQRVNNNQQQQTYKLQTQESQKPQTQESQTQESQIQEPQQIHKPQTQQPQDSQIHKFQTQQPQIHKPQIQTQQPQESQTQQPQIQKSQTQQIHKSQKPQTQESQIQKSQTHKPQESQIFTSQQIHKSQVQESQKPQIQILKSQYSNDTLDQLNNLN